MKIYAVAMNDQRKNERFKYREQKEKELRHYSEPVSYSNYVSPCLAISIVPAIIVFLNVGSWYDDHYGFDGSAGAAFMAAIGTVLLFVMLGAVLASFAEKQRKREIIRIEQKYDAMAEEYEAKVDAMAEEYGKSIIALAKKVDKEKLRPVIDRVLGEFVGKINNNARPEYKDTVVEHIDIFVSNGIIHMYDDNSYHPNNKVLDFEKDNVKPPCNEDEKYAFALRIAHHVAKEVKEMFPRDPSGTVPKVSITFPEGDRVRATVTYKARNGNFKKAESLFK